MSTEYTDEDGNPLKVPMVWAICGGCGGDGSTSSHLGVINTDEWEPEELDDYFSGAYDRTCSDCDGDGKYKVPDFDSMDERTRQLVQEADQYEHDARMERESERRMGA